MSLTERIAAFIEAVGADIGALLRAKVKPGGAVGQVWTKTGPDDYAADWQSPGGAGGGLLMGFDDAEYIDDEGNQVRGPFEGVMTHTSFNTSFPVAISGDGRDRAAFRPPIVNENMGSIFTPATVTNLTPGDTHYVQSAPGSGPASLTVDATYGGVYAYARLKKFFNVHDDVLRVTFENDYEGTLGRHVGVDELGRRYVLVPPYGCINVVPSTIGTFNVLTWGDLLPIPAP